ncbi:alpha/beta hydrolase [Sphingomonas sp. CL5.1]|uniref:alpha/beta fold hydrolase n=1 Tax=Sphingomonas sp. CL5.1 TaxID=2653203 RepID=UPI00159B361C|nr:alpha/beta hydrolase [Sphingomonas sp. CL5.1]QKR99597.1 alpha/beta hydrolase [Sphingomonas sp. CL5.1]
MTGAIAPLDRAPAAPEKLPGERESFVSSGGLRLRVREWGDRDAPPIVLLHGLRGFSGTWRHLAAALPGYRLIAIDQRGRGESDWDPARNYYTDAYVADLEAVVDALGLTRFVLIGHSLGGTNAYVYAARHPERLGALIVEDIAPGSSVSGEGAARIRAEMAALPVDFASWSEARDYWRRIRPTIGAAGLEQRLAESLCERDGRIGWRYDAAGISATRIDPDPARVVDLWPVVDAITVPTLVIRGAKSDFCPLDTVLEMGRRNPRITAVTVTDASHYVHDDQPEAFEGIVREFLGRHAPSSGDLG